MTSGNRSVNSGHMRCSLGEPVISSFQSLDLFHSPPLSHWDFRCLECSLLDQLHTIAPSPVSPTLELPPYLAACSWSHQDPCHLMDEGLSYSEAKLRGRMELSGEQQDKWGSDLNPAPTLTVSFSNLPFQASSLQKSLTSSSNFVFL